MTTLYDLLRIDATASADDIKRAYRERSKETHPDVNNGKDDEFKDVKHAYEVLSDEEKRAHYNETGEHDEKNGPVMERHVEYVLQTFLAVCEALENDDVGKFSDTANPFSITRTEIDTKREQGEHVIKDAKGERRKLYAIRDLLPKRRTSLDMYRKGLQAQIDGKTAVIEKVRADVELCVAALATLNSANIEGLFEEAKPPRAVAHLMQPGLVFGHITGTSTTI